MKPCSKCGRAKTKDVLQSEKAVVITTGCPCMAETQVIWRPAASEADRKIDIDKLKEIIIADIRNKLSQP